jgi:hypothetical protein
MKKLSKVLLWSLVALPCCGTLTRVAAENPTVHLEPTVTAARGAVEHPDLFAFFAKVQNKNACPPPPTGEQCSSVDDCSWLACPEGRYRVCHNYCGVGHCECQLEWWG